VKVRCSDGPWKNQVIDNFSAVPSQRVPVYAPAASGAVCDDEQVVSLLGHYELTRCPFGDCAERNYIWKEAQ
jgi:hypothetical protein